MLRSKNWSLFAFTLLLFPFSTVAGTKYTTWNIEWLTSHPSERFKPSQRNDQDFAALQKHFATIDSDILAFQEVNDKEALQRVVGSDYQLYFSERSKSQSRHHQFEGTNQYTGFAVKNGIEIKNKADLRLDRSRNSKLRFASYVIVSPNSSEPIHALSVHLKAGCSGAYRNSKDCKTLKQQGVALNQWIAQREGNNQEYIVLGDFNHNLTYRDDWLWEIMVSGTNAKLASKQSKPACKVKSRNNPNRTHQFRSLIDHIIVSDGLRYSKPTQDLFPVPDVLNYQLSDHCALSAAIE